jgi:hypothetical protein
MKEIDRILRLLDILILNYFWTEVTKDVVLEIVEIVLVVFYTKLGVIIIHRHDMNLEFCWY